ncbi:hypothetical protein [Candidatus Phytoplasma prunorum]|uniref:hypothetical protein n=1 Tax=Candidatus Phytoplasma prunorum TaxID=47565 RepID=UPI002FF0F1EF
MIKNNKQIIKQVINLLLLVLPLIMVITVFGQAFQLYKKVTINFDVDKRPEVVMKDETAIQNDFECTELVQESDSLIQWEKTGFHTKDLVTSKTFEIVNDYPKLQNDGIVTKCYLIKFKDNVLAEKNLYVALNQIHEYVIHKTSLNDDSVEQKQYFEQNGPIQFFVKKDNVTNNDSPDAFTLIQNTHELPNNSGNNVNSLGNILLQEGPHPLNGKNNKLITRKEAENDSSLQDQFKQQYAKSKVIKLKIQFKIKQQAMEEAGLWDAQKRYLTNEGKIKLSAVMDLSVI